jgi:excisionase family DNA binding protein
VNVRAKDDEVEARRQYRHDRRTFLDIEHPAFKPLALRRKPAANALGFGVTKLDLLIATGEIGAVKSGKCLLIPVAELERYLANLPRAELNIAKRSSEERD